MLSWLSTASPFILCVKCRRNTFTWPSTDSCLVSPVGTCLIAHYIHIYLFLKEKNSKGEGQYFNECVVKECWDRFVYKSIRRLQLCAQDGPSLASNWRIFGLFMHYCQVHRQIFVHQQENGFSSCSAIYCWNFRRLPRCGCCRSDLSLKLLLAPRSGSDSHNHQWSN